MARKAEPPLLFLSIPEILDQIHIEFHVVWREKHTHRHTEKEKGGMEKGRTVREKQRGKWTDKQKRLKWKNLISLL